MVLSEADLLTSINQVLRKKRVGVSAIKLTKTTFDGKVLGQLKEHKFLFIYLVCLFYST